MVFEGALGNFTNATAGGILRGVNIVFTETTGMPDYWWVGAVHIGIFAVVGIGSKHPGATGAYGLVASVLLLAFDILPHWAQWASYIMIVMSIAMLLYQILGISDR